MVLVSIATARLFMWPPTDRPQRVDAIVSFDGPGELAREHQAIALAEAGYAPVLVVSQGYYRSAPCPSVPRIAVVCFEPNPARTVGEAEWVARYARQHGWHSLMIVPSRPQALRAGLLMRRCFSGRVLVTPAKIPASRISYQIIYEWGALAKALLLDRHC
jgi:uncharacterized SAM-binding protein YcdF (DUF218 family)